jgi:hypothetical protein
MPESSMNEHEGEKGKDLLEGSKVCADLRDGLAYGNKAVGEEKPM